MKKTRNTRQRGVILDILQESCSHPTAETVYREARRVLPNISLGTVYRNLNFLRDQGAVREIRPSDGGSSRFEGAHTPHAHFHCVHCNALLDIPLPGALENLRFEEEEGISAVSLIDLHVIGSCSGCEGAAAT
ncbi:Fur family transcriptional regulator [Candidatus Deferrimicrobium sp.]|uniref:Fur family transcriptional regulator n=1 Tax=Candidatus Deferrimicrobium sp. TaxID=3060586 RepID=UPI003C357D1E